MYSCSPFQFINLQFVHYSQLHYYLIYDNLFSTEALLLLIFKIIEPWSIIPAFRQLFQTTTLVFEKLTLAIL